MLEEALEKLKEKDPTAILQYLEGIKDTEIILKNCIFDDTDDPGKSETYQSIIAIDDYARENGSEVAKMLRTYLEGMDWKARKFAYQISNEYWRYVDKQTRTNCVFSVGYPIGPDDAEQEYEYICHSSIDGAAYNVFCGFATGENGNLEVDLKLQRQRYLSENKSVVDAGYFCTEVVATVVIPYGTDVTEAAKKLAEEINKTIKLLRSFLDRNPEYNRIAGYQAEEQWIEIA